MTGAISMHSSYVHESYPFFSRPRSKSGPTASRRRRQTSPSSAGVTPASSQSVPGRHLKVSNPMSRYCSASSISCSAPNGSPSPRSYQVQFTPPLA